MNKEFNFVKPDSLKESARLLKDSSKQAFIYAGGTDQLGLIKHQIVVPDKVISLKNIPELDTIEKTDSGVKIGSMVRLSDLITDKIIATELPLLAETAREIASPQLRNMGTVGGNVCQRPRCWYYRENFDCLRKGGDSCFAYDGENKYHCIVGGGPCYIVHPSDLAVALSVLDAKVIIFNGQKKRTVPINEFFVLPEDDFLNENILKSGEIVTGFEIKKLKIGSVSRYIKIKERGSWDFAVVSLAFHGRVKNGRILESKMAWGGVAPVPWVDSNEKGSLVNFELTSQNIKDFSASLFSKSEPLSHNSYKVIMAQNLVTKLFMELSKA